MKLALVLYSATLLANRPQRVMDMKDLARPLLYVVGAAVLLLFSRTATIGAVAYFPVIVNVVLVDLCFGIPEGGMGLSLLVGDMVLLHADTHRLRVALAALIRPAAE